MYLPSRIRPQSDEVKDSVAGGYFVQPDSSDSKLMLTIRLVA
jgi:hypothetical protein